MCSMALEGVWTLCNLKTQERAAVPTELQCDAIGIYMDEGSESLYIDGDKGSMWVHELLDACTYEAESGNDRYIVLRNGRSIPEADFFEQHSTYSLKFSGAAAGVLNWHVALFRQAY